MSMLAILKSWVQSGAAAVQFLTRFTLPVNAPYDAVSLARSTVWYPFVGLLIGAVLAAAGAIAGWLLPPLPAAALVLAIWVAVTGGLHLDGLMDTADGLLSHRDRERMLEIMKDSRVGAMGVIAGGLQLLMKLSLLSVWAEAGRECPSVWLLLPAAAVLSRAFMTAAIAGWPYARAGSGGLGGLYRGVGRVHAWMAAGGALGLTLLLGLASSGLADWPKAAVFAAAAGVLAYAAGCLLAQRMSGKLGGLTGDTYGALCEVLETLLLLAMAAGVHTGLLP
ncbi:adenosylcobinamide-GDP ribazoletransferase [Paenibacillus chartarius]|uniref:Adenosylcobinamide-GDP ribazoletransferase n=1 Tax=Paenibacillus chartarius TaxID=747481 RepID=A0ABV6DFS0_9BACL